MRNSELLIYLQEYTENDFFIRKSRPGATSLSFNSFSIPNFLFVCCVVFFFCFLNLQQTEERRERKNKTANFATLYYKFCSTKRMYTIDRTSSIENMYLKIREK